MTDTKLTAAGAEAPAQSLEWWNELIGTARLAAPMALTQLGQVAMMTTDLVLIGHLGGAAVAAAALAHIVLFGTFVLGIGPVSAVAPLAAQAFGARDPRLVRRVLRVGLWAAVLAGIPLTMLQLYGETLLVLAGQNHQTAALAGRYLDGLAWLLIPAWCFVALRNFMGAVNRPEPALWITLAAIPANGVLAFVLINGAFGVPRLDILGAGLATAMVNLGMCGAAVWVCYARPPFRKFQVLGRFWRFDTTLMASLLRLGLPISGAATLEYGLFAAAALLMGWLGTVELAAHQVAMQMASVVWMVPFGISIAATVRVGHAVGRDDADGARRAGFVAILLGATFMATMALSVAGMGTWIPRLFLGDADQDAARLATSLLMVAASFFIADGIQTIAAGALRGRNDTRVPLLFSALGFWGVGFPCSWGLAFPLGFGARGIWIGLSLGIGVYACLLVWRFHTLPWRRRATTFA